MHTGLEDRPWHVDESAAYFAERAAGGVGLIVTGGYAPNIRGWLLPFGSQMTTRLNAHRHQRVTSAVHENGGRIALQLAARGPLRLHPVQCLRQRDQVADHAVQGLGPVHARRGSDHRRLRRLRQAWRRRRATTASRSWGPRAT
nr:hypothetical protein [Nocardioides convexus]